MECEGVRQGLPPACSVDYRLSGTAASCALSYNRQEMIYDTRTLGGNGLEVSAIGLGCMSMTGGYMKSPTGGDDLADPHRCG